jgi:TM2 domain-containing membrane protein YozV
MAYVGCPNCGVTRKDDLSKCTKCGMTLAAADEVVGAKRPPTEFDLMASMTDQQRMLFQAQLAGVKKSEGLGVVLALFLGGVGAHHFYMGNFALGIVYALFCWTFIPAVIGFFEAFVMAGRVRDYNARQAGLIAMQIQVLSSGGVAAPAPAAS